MEGGKLEAFCETIKDEVWTNPVKYYRAWEQMVAEEEEEEAAEAAAAAGLQGAAGDEGLPEAGAAGGQY